MRIIAEFNKSEVVKHISHLDLMRAMQRAIRRSGINAKYSSGFNPHLELAFASALSVGITSEAEAMDISIDGEIDPVVFMEKVAPCMPLGLTLKSAHAVADNYGALMAVLDCADYRIDALLWGAYEKETLQEKLSTLFEQPMLAIKKGKAGPKEIDVRPMILSFAIAEATSGGNVTRVRFALRVTASSAKGSLNPELLMPLVLAAFGAQGEYGICRTALYASQDNTLIPLWALRQKQSR